MKKHFVKGQSDNLPKIDLFMLMDLFNSNPSYDSAAMEVELFKAGRTCFGYEDEDEAIGFVQVKRDCSKCIVKCVVL